MSDQKFYTKEVKEYVLKCEKLIENWDNDWCWDTVEGISNWIKAHNMITEKQKNAIDNILDSIERNNENGE